VRNRSAPIARQNPDVLRAKRSIEWAITIGDQSSDRGCLRSRRLPLLPKHFHCVSLFL
jgi:hypothetical protein